MKLLILLIPLIMLLLVTIIGCTSLKLFLIGYYSVLNSVVKFQEGLNPTGKIDIFE